MSRPYLPCVNVIPGTGLEGLVFVRESGAGTPQHSSSDERVPCGSVRTSTFVYNIHCSAESAESLERR